MNTTTRPPYTNNLTGPRPQIEAFSRRRHQLETWRQDHDLPDTAAARQVAVLATRAPKQDHLLEELLLEWRERAVEVGLTPDRLTRLMGGSREVTPVDMEVLFEPPRVWWRVYGLGVGCLVLVC